MKILKRRLVLLLAACLLGVNVPYENLLPLIFHITGDIPIEKPEEKLI